LLVIASMLENHAQLMPEWLDSQLLLTAATPMPDSCSMKVSVLRVVLKTKYGRYCVGDFGGVR
jgi:hypothetical protein